MLAGRLLLPKICPKSKPEMLKHTVPGRNPPPVSVSLILVPDVAVLSSKGINTGSIPEKVSKDFSIRVADETF